jgi:double zinc ribbon protein
VSAVFCGQCGAQLEVLCSACQAPNPAANRFCHRCGQPLTTAAGSVSAPTVVVTHDDPSVAGSGDRTEGRGFTVRRQREENGMQGPDRAPDDVGSPGSKTTLSRLCIVSRDRPLVTGEFFLKALQTSLDPDDEVEFSFIPDRRRAVPSVQPSVDRRRHSHVDNQVKMDGFAIVLAPATGPRPQKTPRSWPLQDVPIERVSREHLGDKAPLASVRNFSVQNLNRKRAAGIATSLILVGLMGAVVVLVPLSPALKNLVSRVPLEALPLESPPPPAPQDKEGPTVTHAPSAIVNRGSAQPSGLPEASSPVRAENPPKEAARESPATGLPEPTPSALERIAPAARGQVLKPSPSARVVPNPPPAPPRPIARVPTSPMASASSPDPVDTRITTPLFLRSDGPDPQAVINWLLEKER